MTTATARRDPRPLLLRVTVWVGALLLAVVGVGMTAGGVLELAVAGNGFPLCFGMTMLVAAVGCAAREVAERRICRDPPAPRPVVLPDGERALLLPRATAPTRISSLVLLGFAAVLAVGAGLAVAAHRGGLAVLLALLAAYVGRLSGPHRVDSMAGGMWFTPSGVRHEYRGIGWQVPWEDVTGVDARQARRVVVAVRRDRVPSIQRTGPRGRAWAPVRARNLLVVDATHLAGGSALAGSLIGAALADPGSRRSLGA